MFIPGALATPKLWMYQTDLLQEKYCCHHVEVLHSESIPEMACRFAKNAPDKFTLIGFSLGGYVALELFLHIPHKIEKLILINTSAKIVSQKGKKERDRSIDLLNKGKFDRLVSLIFNRSIFDKSKHKVLLPIAQEMAHEVGAKNYKLQLNAILNKPDHSPILPMIECPTLVIVSDHDNVMPNTRSQHLADNIKNSELRYLNNCGHMAMLEQPGTLNQILSAWL